MSIHEVAAVVAEGAALGANKYPEFSEKDYLDGISMAVCKIREEFLSKPPIFPMPESLDEARGILKDIPDELLVFHWSIYMHLWKSCLSANAYREIEKTVYFRMFILACKSFIERRAENSA